MQQPLEQQSFKLVGPGSTPLASEATFQNLNRKVYAIAYFGRVIKGGGKGRPQATSFQNSSQSG
jgi:hypothetical protein